jgi:hypothetical protein
MLEPASSSANQKNHSWKYFDAAEILRNVSGGIQDSVSLSGTGTKHRGQFHGPVPISLNRPDILMT